MYYFIEGTKENVSNESGVNVEDLHGNEVGEDAAVNIDQDHHQ